MNYLLEIIVIILLAMTVMFCWRLNNKITEIKSSRKDMANLVKVFDGAITQTNTSLNELKQASANAAVDLKRHGIKSNELIRELAFMNDTAVRLADRLENILLEAKDVENKCASVIESAKSIKKPIKGPIKKRAYKRNIAAKKEGIIIKVPSRKKKVLDDLIESYDDAAIKKRIVNRK